MSVPKITELLLNMLDANGNLEIGSSNSFIGKTGAVCFKGTANFTRPSNTTAYTLDDAITNSTSSPNILEIDLSDFGAVAGQFYCITNARIISSVKPTSAQLMANIWIFNTTFTGTNDNSELSIDDTTSNSGGIVINCQNTYQTALNARCVSDCGNWIGRLASDDTNLYLTLQDASGYTPQSGETFTVILEGMLL